MFDTSLSGMAYNRFKNLDGIEDRIIYYLISPTNKSSEELKHVHRIWKLLYYNDIDALNQTLPKYTDIVKLIYNGNGNQSKFRIFRSPRLEDAWIEECSLLKIYVDNVIPTNYAYAITNIGIDIVVNSKIINVNVDESEEEKPIDIVDGISIPIQTKSRVSLLLQSVLALLNGADIAGVGKMTFTREKSVYDQAQYGLWNNRNFEGVKLVISSDIANPL